MSIRSSGHERNYFSLFQSVSECVHYYFGLLQSEAEIKVMWTKVSIRTSGHTITMRKNDVITALWTNVSIRTSGHTTIIREASPLFVDKCVQMGPNVSTVHMWTHYYYEQGNCGHMCPHSTFGHINIIQIKRHRKIVDKCVRMCLRPHLDTPC